MSPEDRFPFPALENMTAQMMVALEFYGDKDAGDHWQEDMVGIFSSSLLTTMPNN